MLACAKRRIPGLEWSCSQLLQNTPLHPIADWGRQRFGSADMPAEKRLADLENTLALVKLDPARECHPSGAAARHSTAAGPRAALPPEELRRRQLAALTNWWMAGARAQPAVTSSWKTCTGPIRPRSTFCAALPNAVRGRRCLFSSPLDPEFRAPWGVRSHHSTISLAPLDRDQVQHMVGSLPPATRCRRKSLMA